MKGNGFKIAIVGVCLVVAGVLLYRNLYGQGDVPEEFRNQAARATLWYKCTKCGEVISVKPEQIEGMKIKEVELPGESVPGLRISPKKLQYIECPICKDMTAIFGAKCEKHDLVYYSINPDGSRGNCMKCVDELEGRTEG